MISPTISDMLSNHLRVKIILVKVMQWKFAPSEKCLSCGTIIDGQSLE